MDQYEDFQRNQLDYFQVLTEWINVNARTRPWWPDNYPPVWGSTALAAVFEQIVAVVEWHVVILQKLLSLGMLL